MNGGLHARGGLRGHPRRREPRASDTNDGEPEIERVAVRDVAAAGTAPAPSSPKAPSAEPRPRAPVASGAKASASAAPTEEKKAKPITKAMAQAAAKILTADDLVASVPVKKAPPPPSAPRAVTPASAPPAVAGARAARPAAQVKASSSSSHPFDDRL